MPGSLRLAGVIVAVHLAALAVLLSTEYGPFAITLSLLAWVFVNCLLLSVLQRPGDLRGAGARLHRCS